MSFDPHTELVMTRAMRWTGRSTVAIFAGTLHPADEPIANGLGRMEQVGTGVIFGLADQLFLITARHVADWLRQDGWGLAVGRRDHEGLPLPILSARYMTSQVKPGERSQDDRIDVAAIPLSDDVAAALRKQGCFVHMGDIDLDYLPKAGDRLGVLGFPLASPWTRAAADASVRYTDLLVGTEPLFDVPRKIIASFGEDSLFLRYRVKQMVHRNGSRRAPGMKGVSGGGIWLLHRGGRPWSSWSERNIRLVGLLHEWRPEHDCAIGTRIAVPLRYALHLRPDLAPALTLFLPGR